MNSKNDSVDEIEEVLPYRHWYKPDLSLKNSLIIALFGALGIILTIYSIPLPLPVPGLGTMSLGFMLIPPFLVGMTLGPIPGVLVEVIEGVGFDVRFGTFPVFTITAALNAPTWWTLGWWFTGMRKKSWRKLWWVTLLVIIFTFAWLKLTLVLVTFPIFLKIPIETGIVTLYLLPSGWLKGLIDAVKDSIIVWALYSRKEVRKLLGLSY